MTYFPTQPTLFLQVALIAALSNLAIYSTLAGTSKSIKVSEAKKLVDSDTCAWIAPRISRTNHPDLNGIWQALNTANYNIERHLASPAMQLRDGPKGPVPTTPVLALGAVGAVPAGMGLIKEGGFIPYTPEALAIRDENKKQWLERDPEIKCYLPGVPRANYMPFPFEIIQNENSFFIVYEYAGAVRDILFGEHGPAPIDSWMGQSVGHWEGDTLVVEVTAQLDSSWFDRAGNHHSNEMVVTERWTPIGPNHLQYEAKIDDPVMLTEPFEISMPLYRRLEENIVIMDFKCVEFVEELLYGKWRKHPLPREWEDM